MFTMHTPNRKFGYGGGVVVCILLMFLFVRFVADKIPPAGADPVHCNDVKHLPSPVFYMQQTDGAKFGPEVTENTPPTIRVIQHGVWCTDFVNANYVVSYVKHRLDDVPLPSTEVFHAQSLRYRDNRKLWQEEVSWVENRLAKADITEPMTIGGTYHTHGQVMGSDGVPDIVADIVTRPAFRVIKYTFGTRTVMLSLFCRFQGVQLEAPAPGGPTLRPPPAAPPTPSPPAGSPPGRTPPGHTPPGRTPTCRHSSCGSGPPPTVTPCSSGKCSPSGPPVVHSAPPQVRGPLAGGSPGSETQNNNPGSTGCGGSCPGSGAGGGSGGGSGGGVTPGGGAAYPGGNDAPPVTGDPGPGAG